VLNSIAESSMLKKQSSCIYRNPAQANARNELNFVASNWKSVLAARIPLVVFLSIAIFNAAINDFEKKKKKNTKNSNNIEQFNKF
jgi:hypothetical protein